ncbi:hypothetical protein M432DRAFT_38477 [Thermoascus aurantiacus ATCC 26904]
MWFLIFASLSAHRLAHFITAYAIAFTAAPFVFTGHTFVFPPFILSLASSIILSNPCISRHSTLKSSTFLLMVPQPLIDLRELLFPGLNFPGFLMTKAAGNSCFLPRVDFFQKISLTLYD